MVSRETPLWKPEAASWGRRKLGQILGIDLRAVAAFRISYALILLLDLANRATNLRAHYTDFGVLPRHDRILLHEAGDTSGLRHVWSFHMAGGTTWFQALLFLVAAVFAFSLLIGYRSRLSAFVSWVLLVSMHARNPVIIDGGDLLFEAMFFWAMFLPLGAVASVDAALRPPKRPLPKRVLNVASAALLLQLFMMYLFTAALKTHPVWTSEFSAIYYALNVEMFTRWLGYALLASPLIMKVLTWMTIVLEWVGPFLAMSPLWTNRLRMGAALAFIGFHFGLFLTMDLGLFPWIAMASWIPFFPTPVWDFLSRRFVSREVPDLRILAVTRPASAMRAARLLRSVCFLTSVPVEPAKDHEDALRALGRDHSRLAVLHDGEILTGAAAVRRLFAISPFWRGAGAWPGVGAAGRWLRTRLRDLLVLARRLERAVGFPFRRPERPTLRLPFPVAALVAFLLVYVLAWNVRELDFKYWSRYMPKSWNFIGRATALDQLWDMFAPYPLVDDGWFVIQGTLRNDEVVNLWEPGEPLPWTKPEPMRLEYKDQRWRKYLMNLWNRDYAAYRRPFCQYLKRRWDAEQAGDEPGRHVARVDLYYMLERTPPPGEPLPEPQENHIWTWRWE